MRYRTRVVELDGVTTWSYDKNYQIVNQHRVSSLVGSSFNSTLAYDRAGNPLSETTPTGTTNNTYDSVNRLQTQASSTSRTTYAYDAYGHRTLRVQSNGVRTTYTWNDDHRLTRAVGSPLSLSMTYNADGLRFSRQTSSSTSQYVWNGQVLTLETDALSNVQAQHTQEPSGFGRLVTRYNQGTAATDYPLMDALGSVDRITNQSQTVTARAVYDAFGKVIISGDATLAYGAREGYYYDQDSGMYYIRQRWYDPATKQFISPDPTGLAGGDVNLFRYVQNNPVNRLDPSGLQCISPPLCLSPIGKSMPLESPASPLSQPATTQTSPPKCIVRSFRFVPGAWNVNLARGDIWFRFSIVIELAPPSKTSDPRRCVYRQYRMTRYLIDGQAQHAGAKQVPVNDGVWHLDSIPYRGDGDPDPKGFLHITSSRLQYYSFDAPGLAGEKAVVTNHGIDFAMHIFGAIYDRDDYLGPPFPSPNDAKFIASQDVEIVIRGANGVYRFDAAVNGVVVPRIIQQSFF